VRYDREYFLTHHVGSRVLLGVLPDPDDDKPFAQIARALRLEMDISGTIVDVAPDAIWVDTSPTYAVARHPRGGSPFVGRIESRERIAYDRILRVKEP